jgi:hypothetical protein
MFLQICSEVVRISDDIAKNAKEAPFERVDQKDQLIFLLCMNLSIGNI